MGTTSQTVLRVTGMSCGGCVRHVDGALRKLNGVTDVQVTLADGKVVVTHEPSATTTQMIETIVEEGYEAELASS